MQNKFYKIVDIIRMEMIELIRSTN